MPIHYCQITRFQSGKFYALVDKKRGCVSFAIKIDPHRVFCYENRKIVATIPINQNTRFDLWLEKEATAVCRQLSKISCSNLKTMSLRSK